MIESLSTDVLIVGGGIAGLTAAAYLSKSGANVVLCEKEKKTGGLVNSFEYKGFIFDGGIRALENSGIVSPMLKQLGMTVEFLENPVSMGIDKDIIRISSKESVDTYRELLEKQFPENKEDIAAIVEVIRQIMGYMDILYAIDNPLFLNLTDMNYLMKTLLPWLFKFIRTIPKINRLNAPVDEYLRKFTNNSSLIDIIAQHFFQKTPTSFALSYFSLYLDYKYPRGGTGTLTDALKQYILDHHGIVKTEVEIAEVDAGKRQATDTRGNIYKYKKLLWAADNKTLYRKVNLESVHKTKYIRKIQNRRAEIADKIGGDSIFTLYLTVNLKNSYFSEKHTGHFFYTRSPKGLSLESVGTLRTGNKQNPSGFTTDKIMILDWLKRYLDLTTYEISIPALRDPSLAPEGQTGLIVGSLFDYSLTKHIMEMGWIDELKKIVSERIIDVLTESIYPELKTSIIDSFTSTPLTIEKISGNSEGAITGWAFTNDFVPALKKMSQVANSVLTPIPDVYQAGQWVFTPSGMPISVMTGKLAADKIINSLKKLR